MAAGCLPLFIDIDKCPSQSISALPKNLLKAVLNTPGFVFNDRLLCSMSLLQFVSR
jgi:hypothetical protein